MSPEMLPKSFGPFERRAPERDLNSGSPNFKSGALTTASLGSDDNASPQQQNFHSLLLHETIRANQLRGHFACFVERDQRSESSHGAVVVVVVVMEQ